MNVILLKENDREITGCLKYEGANLEEKEIINKIFEKNYFMNLVRYLKGEDVIHNMYDEVGTLRIFKEFSIYYPIIGEKSPFSINIKDPKNFFYDSSMYGGKYHVYVYGKGFNLYQSKMKGMFYDMLDGNVFYSFEQKIFKCKVLGNKIIINDESIDRNNLNVPPLLLRFGF